MQVQIKLLQKQEQIIVVLEGQRYADMRNCKFRSQILVQKTVEFVEQCEEFLFYVESHSLTENVSNKSIK